MDHTKEIVKALDEGTCQEKITLIVYMNSHYLGDLEEFFEKYRGTSRLGSLGIRTTKARGPLIGMINRLVRKPKGLKPLRNDTYNSNSRVSGLIAQNCP